MLFCCTLWFFHRGPQQKTWLERTTKLKKDTAAILTVLVLQLVQKAADRMLSFPVTYISFSCKWKQELSRKWKLLRHSPSKVFYNFKIYWAKPILSGKYWDFSWQIFLSDPRWGFSFINKGDEQKAQKMLEEQVYAKEPRDLPFSCGTVKQSDLNPAILHPWDLACPPSSRGNSLSHMLNI